VKQLVDLPLEDGGSIKVAVDDEGLPRDPSRPVTRSARPGEMVATASETFEHALAGVAPASRAIVSKLRAAGDPKTITVEFGITISADAGVIVAHTSGAANFRVVLTYGDDG
jgi:NTP-dependent ternary system trypsin peptidase co-occuring protein